MYRHATNSAKPCCGTRLTLSWRISGLDSFDGMSALQLAQKLLPEIPFIFVSGTLGEEAAIEALTSGATDYVLKNNLSRLAPAVRRALQEARNRRERRRAERALLKSESKMRSILDTIGIGVSLISPKMEILELNQRMRQWFPDIDPKQRPICYQAFNTPARREVCSYCPTCKTLKDGLVHEATTQTPQGGEIRNYRIISTPLFNEAGKVVAAIEMVDDITEQLQAKESLQRSNEILRAIIEAAPVAIVGLDLDGHVHSVWNPAAEKMLGWRAQDVMGRPLPSVPVDRQEEFRRVPGKDPQGDDPGRRGGAPAAARWIAHRLQYLRLAPARPPGPHQWQYRRDGGHHRTQKGRARTPGQLSGCLNPWTRSTTLYKSRTTSSI